MSAKKKIETSGDALADKKGGGRGKCYVCGSEEHLRINTVACAEAWSTGLAIVKNE